MVDHVCIKFGIASCIDVQDIGCKTNKQTNQQINAAENPIYATTVSEGNEDENNDSEIIIITRT